MYILTPYYLDETDDSVIDSAYVFPFTETDKPLTQELTITYNDQTRSLIPIFKDLFGSDLGDLIDLSRLNSKHLCGLAIDHEDICLLYRKDPDSTMLSVCLSIDHFYDALDIDHFSIGAYNYLGTDKDTEPVEAVDFQFDFDQDNILVNVACATPDGEEADSYIIPRVDYDFETEDDA